MKRFLRLGKFRSFKFFNLLDLNSNVCNLLNFVLSNSRISVISLTVFR